MSERMTDGSSPEERRAAAQVDDQRAAAERKTLEHVKAFCIAQRESHGNLRESDPEYAEYHRGAALAYALVVERLGGESAVNSPIERLRRTEEDLDTEQHRVAPAVAESKVPSGAHKLRVVLEDVSEVDKSPEYRFIEIDNQDGASVSFPMVNSSTGSLKEIVIPYGRDDAWVSEVAYQVAGAATRPLLEDHPTYVFPAERVRDGVAELLKDFGIARACADQAEEEIGHGAKEVGDRRDAKIEYPEGEVERLLGHREVARAGESRFSEERDCAFALLRWLLPVTVAKRLDP